MELITVMLIFVGLTIAPVIPFAVADAIWEFRQDEKRKLKK